MQSSFELLKQNRRILWLPVLSGAVSAMLTMGIAGPLLWSLHGNLGPRQYVVIAVAATVGTAPIIFFNVAITYAAAEQIEGRLIGARAAMRFAWTRRVLVVKWALFAGVVGLLLRMIENRVGFLSRLVGFLGALAWAVAVFFVVPVLTFEEMGPIKAVERSAQLIHENFGTVTRSALRFGSIFVPATLAGVGLLFVGLYTLIQDRVLGFVLIGIALAAIMAVSAVSSATSAYLRTILYRLATGKSLPNFGIDLWSVFRKNPGL